MLLALFVEKRKKWRKWRLRRLRRREAQHHPVTDEFPRRSAWKHSAHSEKVLFTTLMRDCSISNSCSLPYFVIAHSKALAELNRAPLHVSTTRAQNLRTQLETRLSDLEEMISVFQKPIVFIKLD